jgi:hypothetical protein
MKNAGTKDMRTKSENAKCKTEDMQNTKTKKCKIIKMQMQHGNAKLRLSCR